MSSTTTRTDHRRHRIGHCVSALAVVVCVARYQFECDDRIECRHCVPVVVHPDLYSGFDRIRSSTFDMPEAESELVAGTLTDVGGTAFSLCLLLDYLEVMT